MSNIIKINRGSDVDFSFVWPGGLIGSIVRPFEAHQRLEPNLSLTVVDAVAGTVVGRIEWDDNYPNGAVMSFRVQISTGEDDIALPMIVVNVL